MKNLFKYLNEGILDIDALDAFTDKTMVKKWAEQNVRGKYTLRMLKNGTYKVYGTLILRNYDGDHFGGLVIDSLEGSLYVEDCPNIKSLDGLFARQSWGDVKTKVTGDIKISNCKNFDSLAGIPSYIDGEFVVTDCPKLKSLEGAPEMTCDVTLVKIGKKFSKEQIKKYFKCAMRIMCSLEERENMITEAMSEPHLIAFWDWVKKTQPRLKQEREQRAKEEDWYSVGKVETVKLSEVVGGEIRLDKIRPSDVEIYNNYKDKIKDIRKALLSVANGNGFVIIKRLDDNKEDDYEYILSGNGSRVYGYDLKSWVRNGRWDSRINQSFGKMELCDLAGSAKGSPDVFRREFIIIKSDVDIQGSRYALRRERENNRAGMIENTPEQYREIARANRKRWKEIIAKAKAMGVSNEYLIFASKAEPLVNRFAKICNKLKDPKWVDSNRWGSGPDKCAQLIRQINEGLLNMMHNVYVAQGQITNNWRSKDESIKIAQNLKSSLENLMGQLDTELRMMGL